MTRLSLLSLAVVGLCISITGVVGHMQLASPFPLRSPLNPALSSANIDYSMTSPLVTDGPFPCKGFIGGSSDMSPTATWQAGASTTVTFAGTAVHGGGSCQFLMSYDNGATWNVIQSYMGGCMADGLDYQVTIPAEAPSGTALFAFDWFNRLGNREMYMNCAVVTIEGGGSGLTGPAPFVANTGDVDCATIENIDVVFPDPGNVVVWGGDYKASPPSAPAGFTGSGCGATASNSGASSGSASTVAAATTASTASSYVASSASETPAASSTVSVVTQVGAVVSGSLDSTVAASAEATGSSSTLSCAARKKKREFERRQKAEKRAARRAAKRSAIVKNQQIESANLTKKDDSSSSAFMRHQQRSHKRRDDGFGSHMGSYRWFH